mgnify:CR=1 FL=1
MILSESLCHSEVEQLLSRLKSYPLLVLRVVETYPSEEERVYWQEQGISEWLYKDTNYETLREKMNELTKQLEQEIAVGHPILTFPHTGEPIEQKDLRLLMKSFSKTERKVFEKLMEAYPQSGVLSRKELCDYLWRDGDTSSNMSQLSCLIHKIKRKFELAGITNEVVATLWGRGYRLNEEFCERYLDEQEYLSLFQPQTVSN